MFAIGGGRREARDVLPRRPRSLARTALWVCATPYVVAGSLLAVVFGLMVLAVAVQAFAAALRYLL
jgi:hypothetical protein